MKGASCLLFQKMLKQQWKEALSTIYSFNSYMEHSLCIRQYAGLRKKGGRGRCRNWQWQYNKYQKYKLETSTREHWGRSGCQGAEEEGLFEMNSRGWSGVWLWEEAGEIPVANEPYSSGLCIFEESIYCMGKTDKLSGRGVFWKVVCRDMSR